MTAYHLVHPEPYALDCPQCADPLCVEGMTPDPRRTVAALVLWVAVFGGLALAIAWAARRGLVP